MENMMICTPGTKHAKHDKDATFAYQIVETDRTFTYDAAGKLVFCNGDRGQLRHLYLHLV